VQDFFTGGSGTMSKTLAFAVLFVAKRADVQAKMQREIDDALNSERDTNVVNGRNAPFLLS